MKFFTAERRQAIQAFFVTLAPLVIFLGYASEEQAQAWLVITGAVLQALGGLLALVNVRVGDVAAGWAVVRGVIYTLAMAVSPALVILGFINQDFSAILLSGIALALSSLSSAVAIFWSGKQQEVAAVAAAVGDSPIYDALEDRHPLD